MLDFELNYIVKNITGNPYNFRSVVWLIVSFEDTLIIGYFINIEQLLFPFILIKEPKQS